MEKRFYMVYVQNGNAPKYKHETYEGAEKEAKRLAALTGEKAFVLETTKEITPQKVNNYHDACEKLHYNELSCSVKINAINNVPDKHLKAIVALIKLITIAEAWNKEDGFVPDFSNRNQYKYFPWFTFNDGIAGFVCSLTGSAATSASALIGSRLCFKTAERAKQFGTQFIDLWNHVLLFDFDEELPF